jgi:hypothetical protein
MCFYNAIIFYLAINNHWRLRFIAESYNRVQAYVRLVKLIEFNSCFNFKLSKSIGVFGCYTSGIND